MDNRRRIFLINKSFQLRFAFYVCSFVLALSFAYPVILFNFFEFLINFFTSHVENAFSSPVVSYLKQVRQEAITLMMLSQLLFLSIAFFVSLLMSHRVAGPIYKLRRLFLEARNGNLTQKLTFRKSDYFQELSTDYNAMMESIQAQIEKKSDKIKQATEKLEKALERPNDDPQATLLEALSILKTP